jgi:hypothetical protein
MVFAEPLCHHSVSLIFFVRPRGQGPRTHSIRVRAFSSPAKMLIKEERAASADDDDILLAGTEKTREK